MNYQKEYLHSIQNPEEFWKEKSKNIYWYEAPRKILSKDEKGFYRWFQGGKLNTAYLALDHHVNNGRADQLALIYDSPSTNSKKTY
ncbi:MAG: hypothetical protein KDE57_16715, partial [Calditrichaeota bacterium]|nr:hypothetical protein [Calditrichota bacterium]